MSSYSVGDTIRSWVTFRAAVFTVQQGIPSRTYVLADPESATFTVKPPNADPIDFNWPAGPVVRESVGVFYYDFPLAVAGHHVLHWAGTGAAAVTTKKEITVSASGI